jgi:hypothetical protein
LAISEKLKAQVTGLQHSELQRRGLGQHRNHVPAR